MFPLTVHETVIVLKTPECHGTSSGKYKDYKAQQMEKKKKYNRVACSESENKSQGNSSPTNFKTFKSIFKQESLHWLATSSVLSVQ